MRKLAVVCAAFALSGMALAECPEKIQGTYTFKADKNVFFGSNESGWRNSREIDHAVAIFKNTFDGYGNTESQPNAWGKVTEPVKGIMKSSTSAVPYLDINGGTTARYKYSRKECLITIERTITSLNITNTSYARVSNSGHKLDVIRSTQNDFANDGRVAIVTSEGWKD